VTDIDSAIFGSYSSTNDQGVIINGIKWATRSVDAPSAFATTPESVGMFFSMEQESELEFFLSKTD
jgi:hypothetical protein